MAKNKRNWGAASETFVLVLILLAVGLAAGAASFTHVHDWTMRNSPSSTPDWFGWANAVISELVPIAAMLVMRRRRVAGQPIAYPASLLVGALVLSVTAQLAVAKPGFFGGLVSVVPALAFATLAKLILGRAPSVEQSDNATPAPVPVPDERPRPVPVPPVTNLHPDAVPAEVVRAVVAAPAPALVPTPAEVTRPGWPVAPLPQSLLDTALAAAERCLAEHGRPIRRDELQKVLGVSNSTTGDVMRALGIGAPARATLNGHSN
jgi:hypothetical protein